MAESQGATQGGSPTEDDGARPEEGATQGERSAHEEGAVQGEGPAQGEGSAHEEDARPEEGAKPDRGPTEEDLRAALDRVGVADVLVEALMAIVSLGFRRVSAEARDLPQARLAIESLRALEPVLRESGVDEGLVRDLEQARMNLQLAYAKAVGEDGSKPEER